jgi:hypothetical protein
MSIDDWWINTVGKAEALGEILPQCYFVHHKSHAEYLGIECFTDLKGG